MRAVLTDLDRTLTGPDLVLQPATLARLKALREAGIAVVVVTGRPVDHLRAIGLSRACSALVAENGGLVVLPRTRRVEAYYDGFAATCRTALGPLAAALHWGRVVGSGPAAVAPEIERVLTRAGIPHGLSYNSGEVMLLPAGVDKATGALRALHHLGIDPQDAAAVGDGENDVPMFGVVGRSAAVANAVPAAAAAATEMLRQPYAEGFMEFTETLLPPAPAR